MPITPPSSISLKLSFSESLGKEPLLFRAWAATGIIPLLFIENDIRAIQFCKIGPQNGRIQ